MITPNSPDISTLSVIVTWDISGSTPLISLVNQSTGVNLANVSYAFLVKSPSSTIIHDGNIATPDITGVWSTDTLTDPWPRPFNQIEWSGADFSCQIFAKDSVGNIYQYTVFQSICRPAGNAPTSITTYGLGVVNITPNYNNASLFFENETNTSYKGLSGTQISSQLKVLYPDDETDTAPAPFVINNFSSAIVPVTYDSPNYEFVYQSVFTYDFGNGSIVKIKYYRKRTFPVNFNIDLCPLVCEYERLLQKIETGDCQDAAEANRKALLISGKLNIAMIAKLQPLCGIDLPAIIEEIKLIGGFTCDCCTPSGIAPFNSANLGDYNFQIVPGGGDINGYVTVTGNNIQFTLFDKSYVFKICDNQITTAFTVIPSTSGFTKTYCLNVNMTQLATDLATTIQNSADLINLWSFLGGETPLFIGDGKCIFQSVPECNYTFTLAHIPDDASFARLTSLTINGTVITPNFAFNSSNLSSFQAYLNSLNSGTWTISEPLSGTILIQSSNNQNTVANLLYSVISNNYVASLNKICGSYVPVTRNYVIQKIIDYLCGITDSEVKTSQDYVICYIDPISKTQKMGTVASGSELTNFILELLARGCDTINYVTSLSSLNCANIQDIFPLSPALMQSTDYLLGTKNGACARTFPTELFLTMLQLGAYNQEILNAFCNLGIICSTGKLCSPYTLFDVSVETFDSDCPAIIDFTYNVVGTTLTITALTFANTPSTIQTVSIYYKISTDANYTLYSATVTVNTNGTLVSPANITVIQGDTYNIKINDNCQSPPDGIIKTINIPSGGPGTPGSYLIGNSSGTICSASPPVEETLYTDGSFAIGKTLYTDIGLTTRFTGFLFVVNLSNNHIYNVDSSTGEVLSDTGLTCDALGTVDIANNSAGSSIVGVNNIAGFTFTGSVNNGQLKHGTHTGFTGSIQVVITGTFFVSDLTLTVNGTQIQAIEVDAAGTFTFASHTFAATDSIAIGLSVGVP